MSTLFLLLCAHALADFPLQGDFLASAKNRHTAMGRGLWPECLTAHAFIHGGFVYLITGSLLLGLLEVLAHWVIDFGKCELWYSFRVDQLLHIGCKLVWFGLLVLVL